MTGTFDKDGRIFFPGEDKGYDRESYAAGRLVGFNYGYTAGQTEGYKAGEGTGRFEMKEELAETFRLAQEEYGSEVAHLSEEIRQLRDQLDKARKDAAYQRETEDRLSALVDRYRRGELSPDDDA